MKHILMVISILWGMQSSFAQRPSGGKGKPNSITGEIIGKVLDAHSSEPMQYTNVAIFNEIDSVLVTGVTTTRNGEFHLENVKSGNFYLVINFIGYENKIIPGIRINKQSTYVDLGKLTLGMKSEVLKAFEIVSEKEGIEFKIDRKVINVDKFYTAASGTTVDILENVPSISVDAERNVTLRGSSGFTVLIDGRPTVMDPADALEQYPASAIESIEIITNPSAKYDPEGTAGIINIITKKQKQLGVSGIANVNIGMYNNYGGDVLVQIKNKKASWYVGVDYNNRGWVGSQETYNSTTFSDTTNVVGGEGDYAGHRSNATFRAGVDLKITNKNYWLIEGSIQSSERLRSNELDYKESTNDNVLDNYNSLNESSRASEYWTLSTDFTHKFKGDDRKLNFQLSGSHSQGDEYSLNELFDLNDHTLRNGQRSTEVGPNIKVQTRLNYEHKVHDSLKYEIGYQGTFDQSMDDFGTAFYDSVLGDYFDVDTAFRSSSFERMIHATYATIAGTKRKLGYQFGLRAEFTDRNVSIVDDPIAYDINRIDLFPSVHFSYELPKNHQLMASYSRRIQRPRPWYLEPYITARDQWNYRSGNPDLAPEYIDAAEIGYQKRIKSVFVSAEVYYRYTHDKVERIKQAYPEKGPGVTLEIPSNVGTDQAVGLEFMIKSPLTGWWDVSLMGNLYDYRVEGEYTDVISDITYSFDNSSTNYTIRLNQTFKVKDRTKIQFNSRYNSPSVSAQGTRTGFVDFSASIRMDVIDKKLAFNLQGRNIFGTAMHEYKSKGPNFESIRTINMAGPVITFTATYKLNNYTPKRNRSHGDSGDME